MISCGSLGHMVLNPKLKLIIDGVGVISCKVEEEKGKKHPFALILAFGGAGKGNMFQNHSYASPSLLIMFLSLNLLAQIFLFLNLNMGFI